MAETANKKENKLFTLLTKKDPKLMQGGQGGTDARMNKILQITGDRPSTVAPQPKILPAQPAPQMRVLDRQPSLSGIPGQTAASVQKGRDFAANKAKFDELKVQAAGLDQQLGQIRGMGFLDKATYRGPTADEVKAQRDLIHEEMRKYQ